jgi:hypothetical protein
MSMSLRRLSSSALTDSSVLGLVSLEHLAFSSRGEISLTERDVRPTPNHYIKG